MGATSLTMLVAPAFIVLQPRLPTIDLSVTGWIVVGVLALPLMLVVYAFADGVLALLSRKFVTIPPFGRWLAAAESQPRTVRGRCLHVLYFASIILVNVALGLVLAVGVAGLKD